MRCLLFFCYIFFSIVAYIPFIRFIPITFFRSAELIFCDKMGLGSKFSSMPQHLIPSSWHPRTQKMKICRQNCKFGYLLTDCLSRDVGPSHCIVGIGLLFSSCRIFCLCGNKNLTAFSHLHKIVNHFIFI